MMKLTLAGPTYLKESISIISDLVNEARFKVTKNSLELIAMDPANVAMVLFKLLSSAFVEYELKQDTEIAINLSNLKQVLKRAKSNDSVTLEMEASKLKIQLKSNTTRTFNLPIIEIEEREQKVPELKFPVSISMPCDRLNEAVEDASIVAESMTFEAETGKINISADGDLSQVKIEILQDENTIINMDGSSKVKSKYSIEYLKKMMGASKLANKVEICFGKDYPLKLEYKEVDKLMLSFILAPRVEND
ncbi:proliferating cell nuclear antigen (pcna) [Candidatus Woesearchaeota archaeon]|nr:proliferating cell nuclear antigen (pcna) [Candidatus Woesearchaeota archaeon]